MAGATAVRRITVCRNRRAFLTAARLVVACLAVLASATQAEATGQGTGDASPTTSSAAPVADHHVHLLSPAAAALATPPVLPEIELPAELAAVLRARIDRRGDQQSLAELYTADALYYRGGTVGWARGREAAAGYVRWTISDWPYRIAPVAFTRNGGSAQIVGYYLEGPSLDQRFGSSLLSLVRETDGIWRIASEVYVFQEPPLRFESPYTAAQLIQKLDELGVRKAAVLSNAYYFDAVRPEPVPGEYARVRADNDWTAAQVAQFPQRLVAFCSFNPLRDYALAELERCAATRRFVGIKLHFNAAQLDLRSHEQLARVRRVFEAASRRHLALIVHVRPGPRYGREEAQIFLRELLPAARNVPVQIAHLWGGESYSADALAAYAEAVAAGNPATRNLYFDLSGLTNYARAEHMPEIVARIRQIGLSRMLYGSDAPPAAALQAFHERVPLTAEEVAAIFANVAPYLRRVPAG